MPEVYKGPQNRTGFHRRWTQVTFVAFIRSYNTTPQVYPPPRFKELIRTIWSLIRPNRVLNLGRVVYICGGGGGGYMSNP